MRRIPVGWAALLSGCAYISESSFESRFEDDGSEPCAACADDPPRDEDTGEEPALVAPATLDPLHTILPDDEDAPQTDPTVLRVGPGQAYAMPSDAAAAASDGDEIVIDAGTYTGDVVTWTQDDLLIRGTGGLPVIVGETDVVAEGLALWVVTGDHVVIEDMAFEGAHIDDATVSAGENDRGTGVWVKGSGITLRRCSFTDGEGAIRVDDAPDSDVLLDRIVAGHNGYTYDLGENYAHTISIGAVRTFTLQFSYLHDTTEGSYVKSYAETSLVQYNRIMDESTGSGSYQLDFSSDNDNVYVLGNVIHQSAFAANPDIISIGSESPSTAPLEVFIVNNTIVNEDASTTFVRNRQAFDDVYVYDNLFLGTGTAYDYATAESNVVGFASATLVDPETYDYRLLDDSLAIGLAVPPPAAAIDLVPLYEYVHPANYAPRPDDGDLDGGAFEFVP